MIYRKLFILMEEKGIKKINLRQMGLSPTIVSRLVKNHDVNTSTLRKLCSILDCQPGDIMEYKPDWELHLQKGQKDQKPYQDLDMDRENGVAE